jgi:hypothetical protein
MVASNLPLSSYSGTAVTTIVRKVPSGRLISSSYTERLPCLRSNVCSVAFW